MKGTQTSTTAVSHEPECTDYSPSFETLNKGQVKSISALLAASEKLSESSRGTNNNISNPEEKKENTLQQVQVSGKSPGQLGSREAHRSSTTAAVLDDDRKSKPTKPDDDTQHSASASELASTQYSSCGISNTAYNSKQNQNSRAPIVMSCRARGMADDHNPQTAYFLIPENVEHGTDLVCSHEGCRASGVKFCYCLYCKAPFAKRNFRQRHLHAEDIYGAGGGRAVSGGSMTSQQPKSFTQASSKNVETSQREAHESSQQDLLQQADEAIIGETCKPTNSNDTQPREPAAARAPPLLGMSHGNRESADSSGGSVFHQGASCSKPISSADSSSQSTLNPSREELIEIKRKRWRALFDERPDNSKGDALGAWLLYTADVADRSTRTPLPGEETKDNAAGKDRRRGRSDCSVSSLTKSRKESSTNRKKKSKKKKSRSKRTHQEAAGFSIITEEKRSRKKARKRHK